MPAMKYNLAITGNARPHVTITNRGMNEIFAALDTNNYFVPYGGIFVRVKPNETLTIAKMNNDANVGEMPLNGNVTTLGIKAVQTVSSLLDETVAEFFARLPVHRSFDVILENLNMVVRPVIFEDSAALSARMRALYENYRLRMSDEYESFNGQLADLN